MNIFLVIPTIRSLSFLSEWKEQFKECSLIIVEDHKEKEIVAPTSGFRDIYHYCWKDIRQEMQENEWIFSRQNAGIRSYGFWKAHELGADVVITLDDDCFPVGEGFVDQHVSNLLDKAPSHWFPTFPHPSYMFTRGFPYAVRGTLPVLVSHGLWSNKMDMDAKTQLAIGDVNVLAYPPLRQFVPSGYYFPMSSMNLAFTRQAIPLMYFPLMGKDPNGVSWGYDRYDDIWAGIFVKKIVDHLGFAVVNGSPFVEHKKASDPEVNLVKEKEGMLENEKLWKEVSRVTLTGTTVKECFEELLCAKFFEKSDYFRKLQKAMRIWVALFSEHEKE
ncbi:hypothetical protein KBC80_02870 [Candidatus Woesebacteria bacterium]|nr:hypothetical protein [Candidatus Woesebacteria bacterium]